ncbi:MAG: GatB/YqeY domain-containing protein [Candidatus Pacebacteria bacterium]|nr:GatB/YqeY domain-containing protein [Candidatus Paceibacterota bacterium]MDD2757163.1 GatB/YqeY domain-containing protein [Candidatus Paceibacterota bacterium]MDD3283665.1 GatB/YqeY domain-containing protein [Candidatus Paceibacterota bacterium]MDD3969711.1 GatB/YqeY domain-containing protein [Candidatus Paceibacterota bacterium]MDD4737693.1 GatB/YqeY domain-containing protein [Candidatus Paceibacterota bacterium]
MIIERIKEDLSIALKQKKEPNISVLRMVISAVLNKEIERRGTSEDPKLNDEELEAVIFSEIKKRRDSVESFEKGGRADLVAKEKAEIDILMGYMPEEMTEEEIRKIVKEIIKNHKDVGSVMKEVVPKTKGRADGSLVAKIVKEELS